MDFRELVVQEIALAGMPPSSDLERDIVYRRGEKNRGGWGEKGDWRGVWGTECRPVEVGTRRVRGGGGGLKKS